MNSWELELTQKPFLNMSAAKLWEDIPENARYHLCKIYALTSLFLYCIGLGIYLEINYNFIKLDHEQGFQWKAMICIAGLIGIIFPCWSIMTKQDPLLLIIIMPIIAGIASGIMLICVLCGLLKMDIDQQMIMSSKPLIILKTLPILSGALFNVFMFMILLTTNGISFYFGSFIIQIGIVILTQSQSYIFSYLLLNISFFCLTIAPTQILLFPVKKYNNDKYQNLDYVEDLLEFLVEIITNKTISKYFRNLTKK